MGKFDLHYYSLYVFVCLFYLLRGSAVHTLETVDILGVWSICPPLVHRIDHCMTRWCHEWQLEQMAFGGGTFDVLTIFCTVGTILESKVVSTKHYVLQQAGVVKKSKSHYCKLVFLFCHNLLFSTINSSSH